MRTASPLRRFAAAACIAAVGAARPPAPIHTFTVTSIQRDSERTDAHGRFLPPFRAASLMFQFWTKPRPGRTVTILPVNADLPVIHAPFSLGEGGAGNVAIADPRYLSFPAGPHRLAESPFDVVVLYPQNESARPVPTKSLTAAMLPLGVAVTTIIAAVDLDGDKLPDLLASEYCCQATPPLPGTGCDLACRNYYQKKSGKWIRLRHARPS